MGAFAQSVTSFTVVNADTGADIATFTSAGTVTLGSVRNINVRANAIRAESVVFVDGQTSRTENHMPYSYKGNEGQAYLKWSPAAGTYNISATPYSGDKATGAAGPTATLKLTVVTTVPPVVDSGKPATRNEAARFLAQATFGPVDADIDRLMAIGYSAWIDEQLALPRGMTHLATLDAAGVTGDVNDKEVVASFWKQALTAPDQLRQRMAYALSQIFVISLVDSKVDNYDRGVAAYLDMLARHSFGNYRDLLQSVALNPLMGIYLTHLANQKADTTTGRVPDENFARESMQLFSIGLVELNQDGTPKIGSNGAAIETYTGDEVAGLARVFTGWSWACPAYPSRNCFLRGEDGGASDPDRSIKPMVNYAAFHSAEPKVFLGTTIPASTSAADSLRIALDRLASHPNVGPFIGRQLIQRFTSSNPSPAYVSSVARAFVNNGSGVRGDMKAVIKAVLMHPEARGVSDTSGKVREPVLRLSALMRAFHYRSATGQYDVGVTDSPSRALAQAPMHAPSVFNFYRPGYVATGTQSAARNLVAPELQIADETSVAGYVNYMRDAIGRGVGHGRELQSDYTAELALAADAPALVERVTTRLAYGAIGAARRAEIVNAVNSINIPAPNGRNQSQIDTARRNRVNTAVLLAASSPEFVVLK